VAARRALGRRRVRRATHTAVGPRPRAALRLPYDGLQAAARLPGPGRHGPLPAPRRPRLRVPADPARPLPQGWTPHAPCIHPPTHRARGALTPPQYTSLHLPRV
jgi:hypothetical protein